MPQKKTKVIREIPENPFIQGQAKRKKLRVAAYCRVSTEQEEQESSFENQVAYYTDLIQSNPEWEFAGIFADRGISGTKDTIRPEFMKMIEHCQRHKIDLIFTKSLSRFSRNTLDSIKYIRLLKSLNTHRKRILQRHRNARQMHGAEKNLDRLRQHREEKTAHDPPAHGVGGFLLLRPPHAPGALRRAASSRRDRPPTSVSKQSAHTVSPPCAHGHRYASSHAGSGAKHTSHRRIRIPPFRLQNYYAFG